MTIKDARFSRLLTTNFIPLLEPGGKLYLGKHDIQWLTSSDIARSNRVFRKRIPSLQKTVAAIRGIEVAKLTDQQYRNLLENLQSLNARATRHNEKIDKNFARKTLDFFLSFVTLGRFSLRCQTLDETIEKVRQAQTHDIEDAEKFIQNLTPKQLSDENWMDPIIRLMSDFLNHELSDEAVIHLTTLLSAFPRNFCSINHELATKFLEKLSERVEVSLTLEERNKFYLTLNDDLLRFFYREHCFVDDNGLWEVTDASGLNEDQKKLLDRLFRISHKDTLLEIQTRGPLREILLEVLKGSKELSSDFASNACEKALSRIHQLSEFITTDSLLKVLLYVGQNWAQIVEEKVGKRSESRPHILKISDNEGRKIEYDTATKIVKAKLGLLGTGTFKSAYKDLQLQTMEMRAPAKQEGGIIAEQERKIMKAVKGLPHVVQLHEAYEYTSKKRSKRIVVLESPLYFKRGLDRQLDAIQSNRLNQLQIAVDTFEGVNALHKKGIIHRDLKPANIFIDPEFIDGEEKDRAIIGDLGSACYLENDPRREAFAGTRFFMPPEAFVSGYRSDFSHDAWSLGVTLEYIFYGKSRFSDAENIADLQRKARLLKSPIANPEPQPKNSVAYVIWKLLRYDNKERMSVPEALAILQGLLRAQKTIYV